MERRLVAAMKTKDSVKAAWGVVRSQDVAKTFEELMELKRYMKRGEHQFKHNMIADALFGQRDSFGMPITSAFMREMLLVGLVVGGGGMMDLDFHPHMLHFPFFKHGHSDPTLNVNPFVTAAYKTWGQDAAEDDRWFPARFAREWYGSTGPMPLMVRRMMRISEDDIPEIYKDSKFRYMFAIPTSKGADY
jgi:hypothetical protein